MTTSTERRQQAADRYEAERLETKAAAERLRAEVGAASDPADRKRLTKELRRTEKANLRALRLRDAQGVTFRSLLEVATSSETFGGISFDGALLSYGGEVQPVERARVIVETAGELDRRVTVTRVAAGGLLFGPAGAIVGALAKKKVDRRELYLLVDGDTYSWLVPVKPTKGLEARQFANKVNAASRISVEA